MIDKQANTPLFLEGAERFLNRKIVSFLMILFLINPQLVTSTALSTWNQEGLDTTNFLEFEVLFRHLKFENGSRIDTPAEIPGTQNGTLLLKVEKNQSKNDVVFKFVLDIPGKFHNEQRILLDTQSQTLWTESNRSYLGFTHLWLNISEIRDKQNFTVSYNELSGTRAIAAWKGTTTIYLENFGLQEVHRLDVEATYSGFQYSWTSFYDKDTNLLLRMFGDPSDPVFLGLFGVETLDFSLSLTDTNLDVGPSVKHFSPNPMQFPLLIIAILIIATAFIACFVLLSRKRRTSKSQSRRVRKPQKFSVKTQEGISYERPDCFYL